MKILSILLFVISYTSICASDKLLTQGETKIGNFIIQIGSFEGTETVKVFRNTTLLVVYQMGSNDKFSISITPVGNCFTSIDQLDDGHLSIGISHKLEPDRLKLIRKARFKYYIKGIEVDNLNPALPPLPPL
ncbi:MAG: hypothetical protein ACSHX0_07940 [Akkermansiaceae bacterium]